MKWCLAIGLLTVLGSCARLVPYWRGDYQLNVWQEISVGSKVMSWAYGREIERTGEKFGYIMELIYSGTDHSVLLFRYREYNTELMSDLARPSFTQDLRYDLALSKKITFQDIVIDVDTATPERMRFRVAQGPIVIEGAPRPGLVGIWVNKEGVILTVDRGWPAAQEGLRPGDRIIKIDGIEAPTGDAERIVGRVSGKPNTEVALQVDRQGTLLDFKLMRRAR